MLTIDEDIPFKDTTTYDYELDYGKREIVKPGKLGQKTVTYEVEMHDGIEVFAELLTVKMGMSIDVHHGR